MKQCITEAQLQEIALEKQILLTKLIHGNKEKGRVLPWNLTIGKMIEILEDMTDCSQQIINEGGRYCIIVNEKAGNVTGWQTKYYNELADALWEAVKQVL